VSEPTLNVDTLIVLLAAGQSRQQVEEAAVAKLGMTADAARASVAEAVRRIKLAAEFNPDEELGQSLTRLRQLYKQAVAIQDTKTALAVNREMNRLMMLTRPGKTKGQTSLLTGTQVAALFGVNKATVTTWVSRGLPRDGKAHYDLGTVVKWWKADFERQHVSVSVDEEASRKRKLKAQADRAELELEQLRGKLIPAEQVDQANVRKVHAVKSAMLAVPRSVASLLANQSAATIEAELTGRMVAICQDFASGTG